MQKKNKLTTYITITVLLTISLSAITSLNSISQEEEVTEEEVYTEVMKEMKTIGTSTKENYEKMMNSYKELQVELGKKSEEKGTNERMEKLSEDIITRSESMAKTNTDMTKRMDDMEVAMKRSGKKQGFDGDSKEYESAKEFFISCLAAQKRKATVEVVKNLDINTEEFKTYADNMNKFFRSDEKLMTVEEMKSLSVGVDPDGGYTVTPEMSARVIQRLYESDPIRQLATVESISTDALKLMVDWDEASVGWEGETEDSDQTGNAKFKQKEIRVHTMYAKPHATQQLLEDSAINIEQWIANKVAEKMGRFEAAAFVTGDGIGKPRGFLTYEDGSNYGQIEQVNMGHASQITADGLIDLKYSLIEEYLNRGTFLMNRLTVRDIMKLKDGEGNYLWKPAIAVDAPDTILSLPVRMSTTMPQVAADALSIAIADWRETYTIVDRLGITVQRDPYTAKPFVEFYTRKRVGADVVNFQSMKIGKISE